jgi:methionyl-tRNA formyltransferase
MVIFAYDFPHRKTVDFIFHCLLRKYKIDAIIGAPPVKLNIPKSSIRSKLRHEASYHPKEVASAFNVPYFVAPHNSSVTQQLLSELKPQIGLIGGARILKPHIIEEFGTGIINFHPGLIPEARGLDALFWSIMNNVDLGVTSHLIDEKIDAGSILEVRRIPIFQDDTLFDLSERLYEVQVDMIDNAIQFAQKGMIQNIDLSESAYNRKMPVELEKEVNTELIKYLGRRQK